MPRSYDEIADRLDELWAEQDSSAFSDALQQLVLIADGGHLEAIELLAEILSSCGPRHDAAAAYKWYFVALSQQGYSIAFHDLNGVPSSYRGRDGDFRNEARVSELVTELGFSRVAQLDQEAIAWLRARDLPVRTA